MNPIRAGRFIERASKHIDRHNLDKTAAIKVYAKAYKREHEAASPAAQLFHRSHGTKRGVVREILERTGKTTVNAVARQLDLPNPTQAREAALFHLGCLVNEGVCRRVFEENNTTYEIPEETPQD